jgi:putrescine importer
MIAMLLTATSYGRMARIYPSAGSAYTYVSRGLNPHLGFLAGWAMLLDYLIIPLFCVVYGSLIIQRLVPQIPYVILAASLACATTYLNVRGIRTTARSNEILLVLMGVVLLCFLVSAVHFLVQQGGAGSLFSSRPFYDPAEFNLGGVVRATSFAALTFIGFDAVTTLAEDAHKPERNLLLAVLLVCLFTGIFGGLLTYLGQLVWPDFRTFPDVATAFLDAARRAGGNALFQAMIILLALANIGSGLAGQVGAARLLFAMGREKVLPGKFFAHLDPKTNTPTYNIVLIGVFTLVGSLGKRYDLIGELLNFGAFLGFMGVNLAAIRQFYFLPQVGRKRSLLLDLILPALGFLFCAVIWLNLGRPARIVGGVWFVVGLLYAAIRTRGFRHQPAVIDFRES